MKFTLDGMVLGLFSVIEAVWPSGSPLLRTYDVKAPDGRIPDTRGPLQAKGWAGCGLGWPMFSISSSSSDAKLSRELDEARLKLFGASWVSE